MRPRTTGANLIAIVDRNEYSLDGGVDDVIGIEPLARKWRRSAGDVRRSTGTTSRRSARSYAARRRRATTPAVVIAHTVKGKGVSFMESEIGWHLG